MLKKSFTNFFIVGIASILAVAIVFYGGEDKQNVQPQDGNMQNLLQDAVFSIGPLSRVEKKARGAAVKVLESEGYGSGTYVTYKGFHLVITAYHVVKDSPFNIVEIQSQSEQIARGKIVHTQPNNDFAVVSMPNKIKGMKPIKLKTRKTFPDVGTELTYSGFPNNHDVVTFRGRVAGFENTPKGESILLHTYGWFGASGSGVYDSDGYLIGILWAVSVGKAWGDLQIVEDIAYVSPTSNLDLDVMFDGICKESSSDPQCIIHNKINDLRNPQPIETNK